VLLAEVGAIGTDEVEELETDRRHAAEMPGAILALENPAELFDVDPGLEAGRIELAGARREQDVDAGLGGERRVALLVPRIGGEVLSFAELRRVDEEAGDHEVVFVPRRAEEREVALVERAHRRYETNAPVAWLGAQLRDRADDLHGRVASARTS